MKQIIYGYLWTAQLENELKLIFSEYGQAGYEIKKGDISTEIELREHLGMKWNISGDIRYISGYETKKQEESPLRMINPCFVKEGALFNSKSGIWITSQCFRELKQSDEKIGIDLNAHVFSIEYRDSRDRLTNPFHYTGVIAKDNESAYEFFRGDLFYRWMFNVGVTELSDLVIPDKSKGEIASRIYFTPNVIKNYLGN